MNGDGASREAGALGEIIVARIAELGAISETPGVLTRVYLSPEHRRGADLLMRWMHGAGMRAHLDAIGNVCGRYEADQPHQPCLMLGSHYDTVRDAGRWDGPLGILTAIACVDELHRRGRHLPFAIEIVAFADEEGVRFASTLLGSRAVAGTFNAATLDDRDRDGVAMSEAMRVFGLDPDRVGDAARSKADVLAYVELHIEQGPVLEAENLPVGIVTAISGATRLAVTLGGVAGHAGTVPMHLRRDALAGAAECIVSIEALCRVDTAGLVGTVGVIGGSPGAGNVIPGHSAFTVDIRAPDDAHRESAVREIRRRIAAIAERRELALQINVTHENQTAPCALWLRDQIAASIVAEGIRPFDLPSGAGHDGMAMIDLTDVGMIFVRCRGGISHNPAEHVDTADADAGARVLLRLIERFRPRVNGSSDREL